MQPKGDVCHDRRSEKAAGEQEGGRESEAGGKEESERARGGGDGDGDGEQNGEGNGDRVEKGEEREAQGERRGRPRGRRGGRACALARAAPEGGADEKHKGVPRARENCQPRHDAQHAVVRGDELPHAVF